MTHRHRYKYKYKHADSRESTRRLTTRHERARALKQVMKHQVTRRAWERSQSSARQTLIREAVRNLV